MNGNQSQRYSIGELADAANVSRRTVRYYVQRGLVAPPLGGGRGSYYTESHVEQIVRVRQLQQQGVPLDGIAAGGPPDGRFGDSSEDRQRLSRPEFSWRTVARVRLAPGVYLEVAAELAAREPGVIARLTELCSRELRAITDAEQRRKEGETDEQN